MSGQEEGRTSKKKKAQNKKRKILKCYVVTNYMIMYIYKFK